MSKKGPKIILQHFLRRSPHHTMQRIYNVGYQIPSPAQKVNDEVYLDNTLSKLYCDFLISNQYSHLQNRPMRLLQDTIISQSPHLLQLGRQQKQNSQIQKKLISTIKKLNQSKHLYVVYSETEQLISEMTPEQAYKCKKYLMYIYKCILSQKGRINPELDQLGFDLKKIVVSKICEAHTKNEEQELIKNELERLQILAKARQFILKGDSEQAKINYEIVFENLDNNQTIRMEALEYLCKNSQEKGDLSYLLGMMVKIKQFDNEERHMQYVRNALSKLTKNSGSRGGTNSSQS